MHSNLFCHLTEYTIDCLKKSLNENNIESLKKILNCKYLMDNDRFCLLTDIDPCHNNKSSWRPLHHAVIHDFFDGAELLISKMNDFNISVDIFDGYGNTPLHFAAMRGNIEIAKLLIENGADINSKNKQNETPLDKAKQCGYGYIVQELKALFEEIENFKCVQKMFEEIMIEEDDEDSDDATEVYYSSENEDALDPDDVLANYKEDVNQDDKKKIMTCPLVKVLSLYGNDFSKRFISAKS